jgi:hypothetical protein
MSRPDYKNLRDDAQALSVLLKDKGCHQPFHFLSTDMTEPLDGRPQVLALIWTCTQAREIPPLSLETDNAPVPRQELANESGTPGHMLKKLTQKKGFKI